MEFTGHAQVSKVLRSYVFSASEFMKSAVNGMDQFRQEMKAESKVMLLLLFENTS
jgi:hypothetical protein